MFTRIPALAVLLFALSSSACAFEPQDVAGSTDAVSGRPYFDVFQGTDNAYRFRFRAANHEIVLASQGYSSRSAALNGVLSVCDNGENAARYRVKEARNGAHYFTLHARNGRIIGMSEMYSSRAGAHRGADTVARNVTRYLDYLANRTGARFDVFRGADERFYFSLHAKNGEIVLQSQGYSSEAAALSGTFTVADNGVSADRFDVRPANGGGYYFNLEAANGHVIATSEVYATRYNAERAVDAIVELLPDVELL